MSPMSQLHLVRQPSFELSQEQYQHHQQQQQSQLDEGALGSEMARRAVEFRNWFGVLVEAQALKIDATASKFEEIIRNMEMTKRAG